MIFDDYPRTLPSHTRPGAPRLIRRDDCFAARHGLRGLDARHLLAEFREEGWRVLAGPPPSALPDHAATTDLRPVYAATRAEPPALPTGRVFVQVQEGVDLAALVEPLGYVVDPRPVANRGAAWLRPASGSVALGLSGLEHLAARPAILSAEPQLLRPLSRRRR